MRRLRADLLVMLVAHAAIGCGDDGSSGSGGSGSGGGAPGGAGWIVIEKADGFTAIDLGDPARRSVTLQAETRDTDFATSSDDRRRHVAKVGNELYLFAPEQSPAWTRLDHPLEDETFPSWAPIGQRLVLSSLQGSDRGPSAVVDFEADPAGRIVELGSGRVGPLIVGGFGGPTWSHDGSALVLYDETSAFDLDLYLWDALQPTAPPRLVIEEAEEARLSPTAPLLAVVGGPSAPQGSLHDLRGGAPPRDLGGFDVEDPLSLVFSPDGQTLVAPAASPLAAFDPAAASPEAVPIDAHSFRFFRFSPGSRWLLHLDGPDDFDTSTMMLSPRLGPTSFGASVPLASIGAGLLDVRFAPDESRIVLWRQWGNHEIYDLRDVGEGEPPPTLLHTIPAELGDLTDYGQVGDDFMSPDGRWLAVKNLERGVILVDWLASPVVEIDLLAVSDLGPGADERFQWLDASTALLLRDESAERRIYLVRVGGLAPTVEIVASTSAEDDVFRGLDWGSFLGH